MRQLTKIPPAELYRTLVRHVALNQLGYNVADVLKETGKTRDDLKEDVEAYRRDTLGIRDGSQIR